MNSFSVPILLYGLEALHLKESTLNSLDFAFNSVYCKVFKIKNKFTINECIYYTGNLPASCLIHMKCLSFYESIMKMPESLPFLITKFISNKPEINEICAKYDLAHSAIGYLHKAQVKNYMNNWFKHATLN